jgi:hypothetical protein
MANIPMNHQAIRARKIPAGNGRTKARKNHARRALFGIGLLLGAAILPWGFWL